MATRQGTTCAGAETTTDPPASAADTPVARVASVVGEQVAGVELRGQVLAGAPPAFDGASWLLLCLWSLVRGYGVPDARSQHSTRPAWSAASMRAAASSFGSWWDSPCTL